MNKVSICIISTETYTGELYVLKVNNDLPNILLDGKNAKDFRLILTQLLEQYVNLDSNWIPMKILNAYMDGTDINVVYVGQIPFETKILGGAKLEKAWPNNSQIILEAIQSV